MKSRNKNILIVALILIIIILTIQIILNRNKIENGNKQIIKEMSESTEVTNLNNQINSLNTEHTDYANYIQTCKTKIATALTEEGVETSSDSTLETMSENISKVLQARTKDATATADNITEGKTAYIDGQLITGTGIDNKSNYDEGYNAASSQIPTITQPSITFSGSFYIDSNWYSMSFTLTYDATNKIWTSTTSNFTYTQENGILTSWRTYGRTYDGVSKWFNFDITWKYTDGKWTTSCRKSFCQS